MEGTYFTESSSSRLFVELDACLRLRMASSLSLRRRASSSIVRESNQVLEKVDWEAKGKRQKKKIGF
jgi:hypothetical protein